MEVDGQGELFNMKDLLLSLILTVALVVVVLIGPGAPKAEAAGTVAISCKTCHADFSPVLSPSHPPVKGKAPDNCLTCHQPDYSGSTKRNAFAARMHLGHLPPRGSVDCLACHKWSAGKHFGLAGKRDSRGKPTKDDLVLMKDMFSSWAGSQFMDNLHARSGITCGNCHGKSLPQADAQVENGRCLDCHGPLDTLAQKTEPKEFKNRNPHKSHLGDIACTTCHNAHTASKAYCLSCHKDFNMKIQGRRTR